MKVLPRGFSTLISDVILSASLLLVFAPALAGAPGRIEGRVMNGTLDRPVPNQEVRLLVPRQGMQQVAAASTDAEGRFVIVQDDIDPNSFYLLETQFHTVAYHARAHFDSSGAAHNDLTVYETTRSDSALQVHSLRILVRAEGAKARVQDQYAILNSTQPPRAYINPQGTFRFRLSPAAGEPTVAVAGLMNMPLPQTPEPGKSPGEYSIRYPLKPGVTQVALGYETDYAASGLTLSDSIPYPIDHAEMYVSPASLSVDSAAFKPTGGDSANDIEKYEAGNLAPGAALDVRIAGESAAGPPPQRSQPEGDIKVILDPISKLGVPLLACFLLVLLWALGVRVAKEWPRWQERRGTSPQQKQLQAKMEALLNSLADLDELFAARKVPENKYWKERLELKAKLVAIMKKSPPSLLESYAARNTII